MESTRGRIVTRLRRGSLTVEELAKVVGLNNDGVRAHLATLERDDFVRQRGTVRPAGGAGKPAYVYELTPEAEGLFPKAYEPVLGVLLDVVSEQLGSQESAALLTGLGLCERLPLRQASDGSSGSGESLYHAALPPGRTRVRAARHYEVRVQDDDTAYELEVPRDGGQVGN